MKTNPFEDKSNNVFLKRQLKEFIMVNSILVHNIQLQHRYKKRY